MKNEELYDEICQVLTWYENPQEYPYKLHCDDDFLEFIAADMYDVLVKVQNHMEECS